MKVTTEFDTNLIVHVRRQWNDYREAAYHLSDVSGYHWSRISGGVNAAAPRPFVHAYVMCDAMISGELAHSCRHGQGPHEIKVCLTKSSNGQAWSLIERLARARIETKKS